MTAVAGPRQATLPVAPRSIIVGFLGAASLLGVYLAVIGLAQGVDHAFEQLSADALFVGLIAAGFGVQIGLFAELRAVGRHHRAAAAVTAAGTGTSAAAMLACCAHHVVDLLPLVGLSAATVFLNTYKTPLFLFGIAMNVIGIIVIGRQLREARRSSAVLERADAVSGALRLPPRPLPKDEDGPEGAAVRLSS